MNDATYMYLLALNETVAEGGDPRDGRRLMKKCHGRIFNGIITQISFFHCNTYILYILYNKCVYCYIYVHNG